MRISLSVLPTRKKRVRTDEPIMTMTEAKELTAKVMAAKTATDAANTLRKAARRTEGQWRVACSQLGKFFNKSRDKPPFSVFAMKGNSKLPFAGFSTLPGDTCPGAGECLKWCYSFKAWRHVWAWGRQLQNTLLLKFRSGWVRKKFFELPTGIVLRLYVDGDFDSLKTVDFWMQLLKARPDIQAYGYSKSWEALWEFSRGDSFPANYKLNLSSGGRPQNISRERMMALSCTRGDFLTLPIDYHGERGFARYDDGKYHKAVREAAAKAGFKKVFSCPGKCGECAGGRHACGSELFKGVTIINGEH